MKRRRQTIIELTPLLDVILILLFLVISQNAQATARAQESAAASVGEAQEKVREMENEVTRLEQENEILSNEIVGYQGFTEYAERVSVTYRSDPSGKKHIYVTFAGAEDADALDISYGWNSARYGENALRNGLKQRLESEEYPVFIVFTYDADVIYKEDYDMIAGVLADLKTENTFIQFVPAGSGR